MFAFIPPDSTICVEHVNVKHVKHGITFYILHHLLVLIIRYFSIHSSVKLLLNSCHLFRMSQSIFVMSQDLRDNVSYSYIDVHSTFKHSCETPGDFISNCWYLAKITLVLITDIGIHHCVAHHWPVVGSRLLMVFGLLPRVKKYNQALM